MSADRGPVSAAIVEKARTILDSWGVRSRHSDWTDVETQITASREVIDAVRDDLVAEALTPIQAALDRLDAMHARTEEAKWGAGRAVAVIRAAMLDSELSPMRVEVRGSCGVSSALGSQWRNGDHWHTVWPEGGHWCFATEAEAIERAIEVRDS